MLPPGVFIENLILLCDVWNFGIPSLIVQDSPHLKTITVPNPVLLPGCFIQRNAALTTFSAPLCRQVTDLVITDNNAFSSLNLSSLVATFRLMVNSSSVTLISLPNLTNFNDSFYANSNPSLVLINLPKLVRVAVDYYSKTPTFQARNNPSLTTVIAPLWKPSQGITTAGSIVDFSGNALSAASVNALLASCAAETAFVRGTVNLSGGTNAAPTGQGIIDKAITSARGVTVLTN